MSTTSVLRPPDEQALIAEARARARRRRTRIALVVISAAIVAAGAALAGYAASSRGHAPASRRAGTAAETGVVTGYLPACVGPATRASRDSVVVTPGLVTVLRGSLTSERLGHGEVAAILPAKTVATQQISNNYRQMFRFSLPPGRYVIVGTYDKGAGMSVRQVSVLAGKVIRVELPGFCR